MDLAGLWLDVIGTVWGRLVVVTVLAVVVALLVTAVVSAAFRALARRRGWPERAVARLRRPFRWLLVAIAAWAASASVLDGRRPGGGPSPRGRAPCWTSR